MRHRAGARQPGARLGLRWPAALEGQVLFRPARDVASAPDAASREDLCWLGEIGPVCVARRACAAYAKHFHDLGESEEIVGRHDAHSRGRGGQTWHRGYHLVRKGGTISSMFPAKGRSPT
jgi:hypothetical protein